MSGLLPALEPPPTKERISVILVEPGKTEILDGAFVVAGATGALPDRLLTSFGAAWQEPTVSNAAGPGY